MTQVQNMDKRELKKLRVRAYVDNLTTGLKRFFAWFKKQKFNRAQVRGRIKRINRTLKEDAYYIPYDQKRELLQARKALVAQYKEGVE